MAAAPEDGKIERSMLPSENLPASWTNLSEAQFLNAPSPMLSTVETAQLPAPKEKPGPPTISS